MQDGPRLSVNPDRFLQQIAESCADFQADCNLLHLNNSKHIISFYLAF